MGDVHVADAADCRLWLGARNCKTRYSSARGRLKIRALPIEQHTHCHFAPTSLQQHTSLAGGHVGVEDANAWLTLRRRAGDSEAGATE
jgi:hypothetical protein